MSLSLPHLQEGEGARMVFHLCLIYPKTILTFGLLLSLAISSMYRITPVRRTLITIMTFALPHGSSWSIVRSASAPSRSLLSNSRKSSITSSKWKILKRSFRKRIKNSSWFLVCGSDTSVANQELVHCQGNCFLSRSE